jgi:hypothetical protein
LLQEQDVFNDFYSRYGDDEAEEGFENSFTAAAAAAAAHQQQPPSRKGSG